MKKVIAILLAVCALGVVMTGCKSGEGEGGDKATTEAPK